MVLEENEHLKKIVEELQEKLSKYTNPESCQKFYEKTIEIVQLFYDGFQ